MYNKTHNFCFCVFSYALIRALSLYTVPDRTQTRLYLDRRKGAAKEPGLRPGTGIVWPGTPPLAGRSLPEGYHRQPA